MKRGSLLWITALVLVPITDRVRRRLHARPLDSEPRTVVLLR